MSKRQILFEIKSAVESVYDEIEHEILSLIFDSSNCDLDPLSRWYLSIEFRCHEEKVYNSELGG